jgi:hypothetical protein
MIRENAWRGGRFYLSPMTEIIKYRVEEKARWRMNFNCQVCLKYLGRLLFKNKEQKLKWPIRDVKNEKTLYTVRMLTMKLIIGGTNDTFIRICRLNIDCSYKKKFIDLFTDDINEHKFICTQCSMPISLKRKINNFIDMIRKENYLV